MRAQATVLADLVTRDGGTLEATSPSIWSDYDRMLSAPGGLTVRIGTLPSRLAATFAEARSALGTAAVAGCAGLGALRARIETADVTAMARGIERLRDFVAPIDGGVVIERAPRALREAVDPWGPVPPPALAVMRAIKQEFDPSGVLNPGRFVGGL